MTATVTFYGVAYPGFARVVLTGMAALLVGAHLLDRRDPWRGWA